MAFQNSINPAWKRLVQCPAKAIQSTAHFCWGGGLERERRHERVEAEVKVPAEITNDGLKGEITHEYE